MKIEPKDALLMIALLEGEPMQGLSTFMLITKDAEGKERYLLFGCKPNFAESVNKTFKRMTALRPPGFPQPGVESSQVSQGGPCPECGGEVGHLPNCPKGICKVDDREIVG